MKTTRISTLMAALVALALVLGACADDDADTADDPEDDATDPVEEPEDDDDEDAEEDEADEDDEAEDEDGEAEDEDGDEAAEPEETHALDFSYSYTSPIDTFVMADEHNTWDEAGVDVNVENVEDVAVSVEAATAGNVDLAHGAPTTVLQAISQGRPLKIISAFSYTFTDPEGTEYEAGFLSAAEESGIETWEDLEGQTVAITGLGTSYDYHLRDRLDEVGLDPDSDVNIVGVPYPEMLGALDSGEVDAALLLSVFYEAFQGMTDVNVIATTSEITGNPLDMTAIITAHEDYLDENPEAATAFLRALLLGRQEAAEDIEENDGENIKAMAQEALDYDDDQAEVFYEYRLGSIGQEVDMVNPLEVPEPVVESHIQALINSEVISEDDATSFDEAVDHSYLQQAFEDLGMTWEDDLDLEAGS